MKKRENWGSRFAVVMAVAGSAVGLGNFLRFPAKAAASGGGAFMIPYLVSFLLLGIPLMWIEWTLGRYGGGFGHGTAPGIFHRVWEKNRFIKYFGVIGIFGPLVIFMYYTFVASWTLAYSLFALSGRYAAISDQAGMQAFLAGFQGLEVNEYFGGMGWAYGCFVVAFIINLAIIRYGIRGGIERFCKLAMPLLFLCAVILMVRVMTLGAPDPMRPEWSVHNGFGFLWNPDFSALKSARVWLEAAGQVFFSLSVGIGVILTYSSYLTREDDVVLSGLSAATTNQAAEIILGGSIIIPAAFVFFGPVEILAISRGSVFDLAFVTMPMVLNRLPFPGFFGFLWFFLLFLAGITSSVSLAQPAVAFMQDEFDIDRKKAVKIFGIAAFILCQPAIFLLGRGVVDELDFWGGTFFLVLFAAVETILFGWVFKMENAWDEIHKGSDLNVPVIYRWIIKYVTPLFLFVIIIVWIWQDWADTILMRNVSEANRPYVLLTRIGLIILFTLLAVLVKIAWRRKRISTEQTI